MEMSPSDNFSGNSDVPRSLSTLLVQARSMLTIRVHIFASHPLLGVFDQNVVFFFV